MIKVHAKDGFYVKTSQISKSVQEAIEKHYTLLFYEEKACNKCEFEEDKKASGKEVLDVCMNCAAFRGGVQMASTVKIGGTRYIKTPVGDPKGLTKLLKEPIKIKEHYPDTDFKRPIRFTGELKPFQREAVNTCKTKKKGVIKAPPRSGKTFLSTAAICEIGKKTMILGAQRTWLRGFKEHFLGSASQEKVTTAKESQVGFCKTYDDFVKYDVCLATPQTFLSTKGKRLLKKIAKIITVVFIDEVHGAAADKYAKTISQLQCEYTIGLSGTPSRKDQKFIIAELLIGPIIYDAKVERLRPHVRLVRTKYIKHYKGHALWANMVSSLENDKQRLKLIAQWAIKDAKNGHMVIIPLTRVKAITTLVKMINDIAGKKLAYPYHGGVSNDRQEKYIQAARAYKLKILVGNMKMVGIGMNIPRASAIYEVALSSNLENCEQRIARVLTPYEDKPAPVVRMFLDELSVRKRCMSNEWFNCITKKFRPVISDPDNQVLRNYFTNRKDSMMEIATPGLYG